MVKNILVFLLSCLVFWCLGALLTVLFDSYDILWSAPVWVPVLAGIVTAAWSYWRRDSETKK